MPHIMNHPEDSDEINPRAKMLIILLSAVLLVLAVVITILLINNQASKPNDGPSILEPDFPALSQDPNAGTIPDDPGGDPPEVSPGGGSVTIGFKDKVTYSLSTGKISVLTQNPSVSTHDMVIQLILVHGDNKYLLAQSGVLKPGHQITVMTAEEDAPNLKIGGYHGMFQFYFLDPETGESTIVDTTIPCTITVTE